MAELLDLGRKRAAAAFADARDYQRGQARGYRQPEAVPFDRRVALRVLPSSSRYRSSMKRGSHRREGVCRQNPGRPVRGIARRRSARRCGRKCADPSGPSPDRSGTYRQSTKRTRPGDHRAWLRPVAVRHQRRDECGQRDVAKPLVIGPGLRITRRRVRPGLNVEANALVEPRQHPRLPMRGAHLPQQPAEQGRQTPARTTQRKARTKPGQGAARSEPSHPITLPGAGNTRNQINSAILRSSHKSLRRATRRRRPIIRQAPACRRSAYEHLQPASTAIATVLSKIDRPMTAILRYGALKRASGPHTVSTIAMLVARSRTGHRDRCRDTPEVQHRGTRHAPSKERSRLRKRSVRCPITV